MNAENGIVVCGDHYAAIKDGVVVGTVHKCNDTQWGWYPLQGDGTQYIPLRYALAEAARALRQTPT